MLFVSIAFWGLLVTLAVAKPMTDKPSFLVLLGDDIGWADFSYNGGIANTPNIKAWSEAVGTIRMNDFHTGGTVCSPTRATILTGRNHFRDCVNYVYGCSDMTQCVPDFQFAPNKTFTIGEAAREADPSYGSMFWGKWHLGSFYNDSEALGGLTSSPVTHGFDHFNATVEVAPTATTNCNCRKDWSENCLYGHYNGTNHCAGHVGPDGTNCCFNYWWDANEDHGVTNYTKPVPQDDTEYLTDSFDRFMDARDGNPFVAHVSFHNCHIPYIGTPEARADCASGKTCKPGTYSDAQLDFYACLNELDAAVGRVLNKLESTGYRDNTMIWFTTDNGPEGNCQPEGRCTADHFKTYPGSAGPLRGRKRDIWEGGHRVPGIISWPAVVKDNRQSNETVVTMDVLATIMDVLDVERPSSQADWAFDGQSVMPILTGQGQFETRSIGWMYQNVKQNGFRHGPWKLVNNSKSCTHPDCAKPMLFNLDTDIGETTDVSEQNPDVFRAILANFTTWYESVLHSRAAENTCNTVVPKEAMPDIIF
eukprot:m.105203 g.105203  ORF g.105203 m.105203 type:complete len:534 (-) comp15277_c0_seq1:117-1718(-)